jgi:hypothetical protein
MAAAKKPTAQQKAQAKARAGGNDPIKVTKDGAKRLGQAALIAASVTPAGRGVKAAVTAAKVAGKMIKTEKAMKSAKLAKSEKDFVRLVKKVQREEKTGNTTRMLSGDTLEGRQQAGDILRRAAGDRSGVYKSTKKAIPEKIKGPGTDLSIKKTATGKIKITNNGTGNSFTVPKKTEITQKGIAKALVKKNKSK